MQTVLTGPDGQTPAIDATTGKPLTMEEMLRRRGIVAVGNNVAMTGPSASAPVPASTAASAPQSATAAAMQARANGAAPSVVASTQPTTADPVADAAAAPSDQEMQALEAAGVDEEGIGALEALGVVAVGTAAAYAAWRMMRGQGNGNGIADPTADLSRTDSNRNPQIIEGEFAEVPATKRVLQEQRGALPAPQKRLQGPKPSSAVAKARKAQTTSKPATVKEPVDAGLARTLGVDSKIVETLRKNPGLARLLATGM